MSASFWPQRHRPSFVVRRSSSIILAVLMLAACDIAPSPPSPTVSSTALTSTPAQASPKLLPIPQGWAFKLSALNKENQYKLDLDVLAEDGLPIGVLSMSGTRDYESHGSPELISAVNITANGTQVLELSADPSAGASKGSGPDVATRGRGYDRTTAEGWRVRATVNALAVTVRPKLADGTEGAVPVFTTLDIGLQLLGSASGPYLGVTADIVTGARAALENLRGPDLQLLDHGVVVRQVTPGSPAASAGLRAGDVVLAINGEKISRDKPLSVLLSTLNAGDTAALDVVRDTQPLKINITLGKRP